MNTFNSIRFTIKLKIRKYYNHAKGLSLPLHEINTTPPPWENNHIYVTTTWYPMYDNESTVCNKKKDMVYKFMAENPCVTYKSKTKVKEQPFYCCFSS